MLEAALGSGRFVVTAELGPPAEPDGAHVRAAARALAAHVDAANVTDNQAASVKMSPLAAATLMIDEGLEPIMQMTGRDRNVMALQSDLLGAWAIGVRTILALSGDPLKVGPYEGIATRVGDVDSLGLARLITSMNGGAMRAGEELQTPTSFLIAGAANPLVDTIERIEGKLESGVGLLQTNVVYDVGRFAEWFEPVVAAGIPQRAPVLVGVMPPRSERMLRYMHEHIPGIEVDEPTFARLAGLQGDEAKEAGAQVAADVARAVREIHGVSGVHIMAPGWEADAVPRVCEAAGIGSAHG
jgi:methylenetetrahydrofolate reductase (NADPH)